MLSFSLAVIMPEKISPEKWQKIEEKVSEAEKAQKKARRAGFEIRKEKRKKVLDKTLERREFSAKEMEDILKDMGEVGAVLIEFREQNLKKALSEMRRLEKEKRKILSEEIEVFSGIDDQPSGAELEILQEIREAKIKNEEDLKNLLASSPEAFYGINLIALKEYKRELASGRIVETPYVKKQIEDIIAHYRAGKPVFLFGHLGSGKTELAMHIARKHIGKDALVISGSKYTSLAELYGHQVLAIDKIAKDEINLFLKEVETKYGVWTEQNQKASDLDKKLAHDRILQTYLAQLRGGTISNFFLGPVYRALDEGRPVIIDEVNAIPHEVLISLNHILTRRIGDTINVQQDTGKTVKFNEDSGFMMTGNLNQGQERYIDRQDLDPAFLSRLYKIEHDYLPQKKEGSLDNEAGPENETFQLLLAKTMDGYGNMEVPEDTPRKLWNLAKAARITQDVFAGKEISNAYYFQLAAGRSVKYLLKESVLSPRALEDIVTQWQKDGYGRELDYYIYKEFVGQSMIVSDRAYLYQMFKDRFGFFGGNGWEQNPNYGTSGAISSFDIKVPTNPPGRIKFFGPREVVEFAYGRAPARTSWPELEVGEKKKEEQMSEEAIGELINLNNVVANLGADLENLKREIHNL